MPATGYNTDKGLPPPQAWLYDSAATNKVKYHLILF